MTKQITDTTVFFILFIANVVQAQVGFQVLRGTVKDHISESPLPGAKVTVLNTNLVLGAIADMDGVLRLRSVPIGRHDIVITSFGYEDVILKDGSL